MVYVYVFNYQHFAAVNKLRNNISIIDLIHIVLCKNRRMKKSILSICLTLSCAMLGPCVINASSVNNPGVEEITMESSKDPGDDRGGSAPVEAYLYHSSNTLYVALAYSVGMATITVSDSFGMAVYTEVVDATLVGFTTFAAPTAPGSYTLEVRSAGYTGKGTFDI